MAKSLFYAISETKAIRNALQKGFILVFNFDGQHNNVFQWHYRIWPTIFTYNITDTSSLYDNRIGYKSLQAVFAGTFNIDNLLSGCILNLPMCHKYDKLCF